MEDLQDKIIELMDLFDGEVTTADKIDRPQSSLNREAFDDFNKRNPMAGGGMLVQPSADGRRPGYAGKMKWTKKEIQEIYKDLPENVYVSKRTLPSGKTDYNYRAKIRYKGKLYTFPSKVATPENKKQLIKDVEAKWDELAPNRISREEYAKLRLLPENRRLSGDEFAEKLNKVYKKVTYRGEKWNRQNVFNYDLVAPRSKKRIADDLGFFEKRTVAEAKKIINKYSGGKHFLKNKNLTDAQITTKAAEYVAMEKQALKEGGKSWPRGRQNKRKVWTNIFESYKQGGRFELVNAKELADEDGTINWRKGTDKNKKNPFEPSNANWRKAKFRDKKSGAIFTYDNLEKMVDKHGGGYQKAIKAYNENAILNQTTFNGKSLNDIIREAMIKKDYEVLVGKKVKANDPGLLKYMGEKKPFYSFTEAHHFKGVKNYPFETEPSFRRANREQGIVQGVYDKAVASGNSERIAKAKNVYINKMNEISDKYGGIRFKMDDKRFIGGTATTESLVKAGLQETDLNKKQIDTILASFGDGNCPVTFGPKKRDGGRIGYQVGTIDKKRCIDQGIKNFNDGKFKTADQVQDAAKLLSGGRRVLSGLMKYGIIPELAFVGLEATGRSILGEKPLNAIKKSIDTFTFGLTDFTSGIEAEKFGKFGDLKLDVDKYRNSLAKVNSIQQDIANLETLNTGSQFGYEGDQTEAIQMKKAQLEAAKKELQQNMISPDKVSFIDRMSDNIADAQMAKSGFAKASLKDQMIGIPGVADYMDTETARVFPRQPSQAELNLNLLPNFREALKTDQAKIDRTIMNAPDDVLKNISPEALDLKRGLQEAYKMENLKNVFGAEQIYGTQGSFFGEPLAKGGRAGYKTGSVRKGVLSLIDESIKKTPKDTTSALDKLIKQTLDEDLFDKKDRIIDNLNARIAKAKEKGLDSEEIGKSQIEFYDNIIKSNFRTKTGPFFDYQKRKNKAGGGLLKQAGDRSGPPPESGPNPQGLQGLLNRVKKT